MNSIDILHGVNTVAISTYNLRFCDSVSTLVKARRSIRSDLYTLRFIISNELYVVLFDALDDAYQERLSVIEELE
ncbi:MAG: hypothetical protein QXT77_06750 [Candidatus Methanomethylicaceae archaeon]